MSLAIFRSYRDGIDFFECGKCRRGVYNISVGNYCQHCGTQFTELIDENTVLENREKHIKSIPNRGPKYLVTCGDEESYYAWTREQCLKWVRERVRENDILSYFGNLEWELYDGDFEVVEKIKIKLLDT